jgi:predicted flap endonuclease-1-like 5' DNA nuclease
MLWDFAQTDGDMVAPILVGFGIVVLVLLSLLLFIGRTTRAPLARPLLDYPGDIHQVVDLEGIGDTYAERLHAAGIEHTQDLLFASRAEVARITRASPKTVARWCAMAELIKVDGIGPQYAEVLSRMDVAGIDDLRSRDARSLATRLAAYLDSLDSTVIGQKAGEKRIRAWIKAAQGMEKVPIDPQRVHVRPLQSKAARSRPAS